MKKLLVLIVALALTLTLSGCQEDPERLNYLIEDNGKICIKSYDENDHVVLDCTQMYTSDEIDAIRDDFYEEEFSHRGVGYAGAIFHLLNDFIKAGSDDDSIVRESIFIEQFSGGQVEMAKSVYKGLLI